jgi:hypothetical protein
MLGAAPNMFMCSEHSALSGAGGNLHLNDGKSGAARKVFVELLVFFSPGVED